MTYQQITSDCEGLANHLKLVGALRNMKGKEMIAKDDNSKDWNLEIQLDGLLLDQPNITHSDLKRINQY